MNKKAIFSFDVLMSFIKIFLLIIVILSVVFLIRSFFIWEVDTFNAEVELFIQRLLYSKALMFYDSDIDRLYPSIVDSGKFKSPDAESNLNKSIYYKDNKKIAAMITLKEFDKTIISSIYFNKEWFERWIVLAKSGWNIGPGGVKLKSKDVFVLIRENNTTKRGYLNFDVIIPN